jgi:hypothetical protein
MDRHIFWGYVVLLLPLIVAAALIPACWLRAHLPLNPHQPQWLEPSWLTQANRHPLDCSHPVPLDALTGCLNRRGR